MRLSCCRNLVWTWTKNGCINLENLACIWIKDKNLNVFWYALQSAFTNVCCQHHHHATVSCRITEPCRRRKHFCLLFAINHYLKFNLINCVHCDSSKQLLNVYNWTALSLIMQTFFFTCLYEHLCRQSRTKCPHFQILLYVPLSFSIVDEQSNIQNLWNTFHQNLGC